MQPIQEHAPASAFAPPTATRPNLQAALAPQAVGQVAQGSGGMPAQASTLPKGDVMLKNQDPNFPEVRVFEGAYAKSDPAMIKNGTRVKVLEEFRNPSDGTACLRIEYTGKAYSVKKANTAALAPQQVEVASQNTAQDQPVIQQATSVTNRPGPSKHPGPPVASRLLRSMSGLARQGARDDTPMEDKWSKPFDGAPGVRVIESKVIEEMIERVSQGLIFRNECVHVVVMGLFCGQHVFLFGPPGTGKSMVGNSLNKTVCLNKGIYFEQLLTTFTGPEDVFGPVDINEMMHSKYVRNIGYRLPTATLAFIDETFKANKGVLNALLTILMERTFHNGTEAIDCPLHMAIGASNEVPTSTDMKALFDRFLFRVFVERIQDQVRNKDFFVHQKVRARNCAGTWKNGEVTAINPVKVLRDEESTDDQWDEVEPLQDDQKVEGLSALLNLRKTVKPEKDKTVDAAREAQGKGNNHLIDEHFLKRIKHFVAARDEHFHGKKKPLVPDHIIKLLQLLQKEMDYQSEKGKAQVGSVEVALAGLVSDRRWTQMADVMKVSALTNSRIEICLVDCFYLVYCCWEKKDTLTQLLQWMILAIRFVLNDPNLPDDQKAKERKAIQECVWTKSLLVCPAGYMNEVKVGEELLKPFKDDDKVKFQKMQERAGDSANQAREQEIDDQKAKQQEQELKKQKEKRRKLEEERKARAALEDELRLIEQLKNSEQADMAKRQQQREIEEGKKLDQQLKLTKEAQKAKEKSAETKRQLQQENEKAQRDAQARIKEEMEAMEKATEAAEKLLQQVKALDVHKELYKFYKTKEAGATGKDALTQIKEGSAYREKLKGFDQEAKGLIEEAFTDTSLDIAAFMKKAKDGTSQNTVLHYCAKWGLQQSVNSYLAQMNSGQVNNKREIINMGNAKGNTALHLAAGSLERDIIEVLINNGADPNAENSKEKQDHPAVPLAFAIQPYCFFENLSYCTADGDNHRDYDSKDTAKNTITVEIKIRDLHIPGRGTRHSSSGWSNENECVQLLIDKKADVNKVHPAFTDGRSGGVDNKTIEFMQEYGNK